MSLEAKIQDEIKAAMLAREKVRLEALRAIKAAILLEKTSDGAETISDDAVLKIIMKLVKQRKESALAENELAEALFMEVFLPRQLSEEELESELAKVIEQVGAKGPQDMGKVMGVAARQLAGRADGKAISMAVKKLLQN